MLVARGETYEFRLYKRKKNSSYEWEEVPLLIFYGRPANQVEKKRYRIQKGVEGNSDGSYILSANLPTEVDPGDHIEYLGKLWTVQSTGYYFENSRVVNASIFAPEQLIARCPKGVVLQ